MTTPSLGGSPGGLKKEDVIMMALMKLLSQPSSEASEAPGGGRAFKKVHTLRSRVDDEQKSQEIVVEYVHDVMGKLGAEEGDSWQLWQFSNQIVWGRLAGLHRCHFHLSHILAMMLKGQLVRAQAYMVQLLRALHQVGLDNGVWTTASLLLPWRDPIYREQFGATERELEAVVAYQEALKKIRTKMGTDATENEDTPKSDDKGGKNGKKGDGKKKDGE